MAVTDRTAMDERTAATQMCGHLTASAFWSDSRGAYG
jgi:hypothetical protein